MARVSAFLMMVFLPAVVVAAETHHGGHAGASGERRVPREVIERPVPLRAGVGGVHDPVTTASPQAQAFYDQGMSYLHAYFWIEAARSFNQALRMDPKLALAYAGLGRALYQLDDPAAARAASAEAVKLAERVPLRERNRVAVVAAGLAASLDQGDEGKEDAYLDALENALAADPDDPELWLIRGNATEGPAGIGMGGGASAIAFYETALRRAPDHPGANHYLVHAYESIGKIDEAVRFGEVFASLAPQTPHAHHMYGHNLRRAGRVEEATREFETAYNLEMSYYARENIRPEYDWHHPHNLSLLAMAYQYQGRLKDAERILGQLFALEPVTAFIEFNRKAWPEYLLVRGRPDEALKAARQLAAGPYARARVGGHAMAGLASAAIGKFDDAGQELAAADEAEDAAAISPYVAILDAALLLDGDAADREEAAHILREKMADIRAIPGPDAWMLALFRLELIARIARDAQAWDLAEEAARQMLDHDPAYPGAHFALGLVLEHKGSKQARREFMEAERLWRNADPDLPELKAMKARRAAADPLPQPPVPV